MQRKQLNIDYKHHVMAMREFVSRCEAQIPGTSFDTGGETSQSTDLRQSAVTALEAPVVMPLGPQLRSFAKFKSASS